MLLLATALVGGCQSEKRKFKAYPCADFSATALEIEYPDLDACVDVAPPTAAAPLTLDNGEFLFVAVQMSGTWPDVSCLATCRTQPRTDHDYWSNAVGTPYSWVPLTDFGIDANVMISALGVEN